jgi:hypothetical protein
VVRSAVASEEFMAIPRFRLLVAGAGKKVHGNRRTSQLLGA